MTHELVIRIERICFVAVANVLLIWSSGTAVAQQTPTDQPSARPTPSTSPTPSASPAPSAQPASATTEVERIVVTANKREENIQEVPSSISVINDVELDNLHATQLTDYAPYVPGLQVTSGGSPGRTTISLRGLVPLSQGATTGTYIDEIPVGSSGIYQDASVFALDLLPYDIRRIEVLRGPQGTLYGANSLGGLLKYVTLEPSLQDNTFRVGGGIYGVEGSGDVGWDTHVSGNIALARDTVGLRLSYSRNDIPGFISNAQNGEKDINSGTQQSALVALLWRPNDVLSFRLTALGQRIESDNNAVVALDPATRKPLFGDLTNQLFFNEPFTKNIGLIAGTLNLDLGFADLTSVTSYSTSSSDFRADTTNPFGGLPPLLGVDVPATSFFDKDFNLDKFVQEVRLTSKADGPFLWQLGAFYTYERAVNTQLLALRQLNGAPFTGDLALLNTLVTADIPSRYTEYAGFANASYRFVDWFTLGGGLRFSRNEQSFAQNTGGLLLPPGNTPGGSRENVFDYMVSPEFHVTKDVLLYGRVATGYQPGGPNVAVPGVPPTVGASTDTSYEAGFKSEFFDHRLLFNVAGYHIELEDIQVLGTTDAGIQFFANGGTAESNGVEMTLGYQPIKALSFAVNGAYTDAFLSEDAPLLGGFNGDPLPFIPKFSASATVDYFFPLWGAHSEPVPVAGGKDTKASVPPATQGGGWNGHVGLGVRWVDSAPVGVGPDPFRSDRYAALDLNADISNDRWTIRAYFRNVTDERAYAQIVPVADLTGTVIRLNGIPIQPRTIGIEIDYKF